jgi:hypothetical protein
MRKAGHVVCMERRERCIQGFVGKLDGNRPLERPRRTWENDIKTDLGQTQWGGAWNGFTWLRTGTN